MTTIRQASHKGIFLRIENEVVLTNIQKIYQLTFADALVFSPAMIVSVHLSCAFG